MTEEQWMHPYTNMEWQCYGIAAVAVALKDFARGRPMAPEEMGIINALLPIIGDLPEMAKGGKDDKAPTTGAGSDKARDDKKTTTEKSKDPNRPHAG